MYTHLNHLSAPSPIPSRLNPVKDSNAGGMNTYSPRRRVPQFLKHSHRGAMNGANEQQQQKECDPMDKENNMHPSPSKCVERHDASPPRMNRNGTRAWLISDYSKQTQLLQSPLKRAMRTMRPTPQRSEQTPQHSQQSQHETLGMTNSVQTPETPSMLSTTSSSSSFERTPSSSSVNSSFGSLPNTTDRSHVLSSGLTFFTSPSPSPSPVHPHQLSFDLVVSPNDTTTALVGGVTSPISTFPFGANNGSASAASTPVLTAAPAPTSSTHLPPLNSRFITPVALNLNDSPSTPTLASVNSSSSLKPTLTNNLVIPNTSSGVFTSSSAHCKAHDSPVVALGTTPPSNPPALSLNPFVSPMPVRVVSLNGNKTHHAVPRHGVSLLSPSPLATSIAPQDSMKDDTGVLRPPFPMSNLSRPIARRHVRMSSADAMSSSIFPMTTPTTAAVTSSSNASSSNGLTGFSRRMPQLNAKRSRGYSLDLEAELESGAELIIPSPSSIAGLNTGAVMHDGIDCASAAAEAITQSMRKLKVKKGYPDSPAPVVKTQRHHRRHSGFSSSDEDESGAKLNSSSSSSQTPLDPSAIAPTQNMKQLRRAKQLQSVQKKRQQQQQQQQQQSMLAAECGGRSIPAMDDTSATASSSHTPLFMPSHHQQQPQHPSVSSSSTTSPTPLPTLSLEAALEAAKHSASVRSGSEHSRQSSSTSIISLSGSTSSPRVNRGLQIAIPNSGDAHPPVRALTFAPHPSSASDVSQSHTHQSIILPPAPIGLLSPPNPHHAIGSRLQWDTDDDGDAHHHDDDDDDEVDDEDVHRRLRPVKFTLDDDDEPSQPLTMAGLQTPLKALPPCEDELGVSSHNTTSTLSSISRHPSSNDTSMSCDDSPMRTLDFNLEADERRDTLANEMTFSNLSSRTSSMRTLDWGLPQSLMSGSSSASSSALTPSHSQRNLTSPAPLWTPLTPAASTHSFTFHLPVATPLPVLPGMEPPKSRLTANGAQHEVEGTPLPSNPIGADSVDGTDFMSPVHTSSSLSFQFPPSACRLTSTPSFSLLHDASVTTPIAGLTTPHASTSNLLTGDGASSSSSLGSVFELQLSRGLTREQSRDGSTTPTSPPPPSSASNSFLAPPPSSLLFALSPDPKAFAESSSLLRKTPARSKLQPPPTPVRPSSIKRAKAAAAAIARETPAKPSKFIQSNAKLLALAVPEPSSPRSSNSSSSTASCAAPLYLPPLRGGRLERTSSLYDSKILIDFKAHLAASAAKKKLAGSSKPASVDEHGDISMDGADGSEEGNVSNISLSSSLNTSTSSPPPPVDTNISIWETQFTDKVLVGSGSFFQTYRCQSVASEAHPDEYGEFFAVKRSIKEFRGKKDRGLYLREIAVMESIGHHENIVKHIRAWQEDLHFFIQMECQFTTTYLTIQKEVGHASLN